MRQDRGNQFESSVIAMDYYTMNFLPAQHWKSSGKTQADMPLPAVSVQNKYYKNVGKHKSFLHSCNECITFFKVGGQRLTQNVNFTQNAARLRCYGVFRGRGFPCGETQTPCVSVSAPGQPSRGRSPVGTALTRPSRQARRKAPKPPAA